MGVVDTEYSDDLPLRCFAWLGGPFSGVARCPALPIRAPRASAATSSRLAPPAAATAATMRPSTRGAGESVTRSRTEGSSSRSSASSALSTALPRSMRTTTPSGPSARPMASMIATASVPNVASSRPAATSILSRRPCSISAARATAAPASARLWETTTNPTPLWASTADESAAWLSVISTALRSWSCLLSVMNPANGSERRIRRRFEQEGHRRGTGIKVPHAPFAQIARTSLTGQHRHRRVAACGGGIPGSFQPSGEGSVLRERALQGIDRRRQGVIHGLVAWPGLAAIDDAHEPGSKGSRDVGCRDGFGGGSQRAAHPHEQRPEQGPARPSDRGHQRHPHLAQQGAGRRRRAFVERGHGGLHAPVHVRAVVGIADRRVELGQELTVLSDEVRKPAHPLLEDRRGHVLAHRQMPHLNAEVLTGASQRESSSSSTLSKVIDTPAMSSEVM